MHKKKKLPYHLLSVSAWTSTAHKQINGWALMIKPIRKLIMSCQASTWYQYLPAFHSVSQTLAQITCHLNVDGRISGLLFLGCFWKLSFRASQCVLHIFDNGHIFHQKIYSNCYLNTHTAKACYFRPRDEAVRNVRFIKSFTVNQLIDFLFVSILL